METRTEKDIPTTSAYSPAKGYISHVAVSAPPPPPPYALHQNSAPAPVGPHAVHAISGLISPPASHSTESRRPSDDPHHDYPTQHQRQSLPSLPSISEALHFPSRSAAGPTPAPPAAHAPPPPHSYGPSPYSHAPPPPPATRPHTYDERSYPPIHSHHMRRSPPPPHAAPGYAPSSQYAPAPERSQPLPALRTALPSQVAPHSPYYHLEASRYEHDPRRMDPPREEPRPARAYDDRYNGYPTAATNAYPAPPYPPRPRSPGYQSSASYSRADPPRPPYGREDMGRPPMGVKRDYEHGEPEHSMMFQRQLEHNLGNHDFEMALGELQQCGMDVSRISEEILETVRRYRNEPDAQGMPAMKYHDQMLGCQRKLDDAFTQVKHFMAQQQRQMEDHHSMKARGGKGEGYGDDEHWGMDKDQNFNGPDQKKIRRGRAAPPGRCHSCNRAETPEWRRGPDGARTLCNACGLHYAKLTRRMGSKNASSTPGSALRPKSIDGSPM